MYGLDKRVNRIVRELERLIYPQSCAITGIEIRRGKLERGVNPAGISDGWEPYECGSVWSEPCSGEYVLFRAAAAIPQEFAGKPVVVLCRTNKSGWNAVRPQMLFYVDGEIRQAFDTNHQTARLDRCAEAGRSHMLHLAAFGGLSDLYFGDENEPTRLYLDLAAFDEDVWNLYHDLNVPLTHSVYLQGDSAEWQMIMEALNGACSSLDLRAPGSRDFHESVLLAREYLKKNLYNRPRNVVLATVSCVGHTHIDIAWLWRYSHSREKIARSLATALALMDEYPEYLFTLSQPQLIAFLKEDYPEIYMRVKERVLEGRLEVEGGMWVESDTNLPSGESLVRQFLHGKRFLREEFGADSRILWLPDVFGYSAALPQILKKSGIDYFMTSKLISNDTNRMPHNTFLWRGIDGTDVLTELMGQGYNGMAQKCEMTDCWKNYKDKNLSDNVLYTYGYGDGGGGPTREMIETIRRLEKGLPGSVSAKLTRALDFFEDRGKETENNRRLAVWRGELYYEYHRGTYTSMARNKRNNRKAEFLLENVEWASVLASHLLGGVYPAGELDSCWNTLLLNQFHDVLPGSSIKAVYDDTDELYRDLFSSGEGLLARATERIAANVDAPAESLVVFNPLSWERETAVFFDAGEGDWALSDGANTFPTQRCAGGTYVSLVRGIPAKGWLALQIVPGGAAGTVRATARLMENGFVKVRLDGNGNIKSLYDKAARRETFRRGASGNRIIAYEDKPFTEDNWNLYAYYTEKSWDIPAQTVELVEQGPVRAVVRTTRSFMSSTIVQDMILWSHCARIDFETTIDWRDRDICLKAEFPVDVNTDRATYEIQYGHIARNTHENTSWDEAKFEVCAHKWADLSDGGFGMSLMNDCKYGHDALNGNLRLTLLRSGCVPNPDADKETHRFTYSILPHAGDWRDAHTVRHAYDINVPAIAARGGGGSALPARLAYAEVSEENIVLEAVKQAEDGDGVILRLYDSWNRSGACKLAFCTEIEFAGECDLMENRSGAASFHGSTLEFAYRPFEIKTFRVRLK